MEIISRHRNSLILTGLALSFFIAVLFGCSSRRQLLNTHFRNNEGKDELTVVLVGNALYEQRWHAETGSFLRMYLKDELRSITGANISVINSSRPEDTVIDVFHRAQADIVSYKPDIVFLMLGYIDSMRLGLSDITFRDQLRSLFSYMNEQGVFVIVLTPTGHREASSTYDDQILRLKQFNEILLWEAGHHGYPVIDVFEYVERLRLTSNRDYRALFDGLVVLNRTGHEYIMSYVIDTIRDSYSRRR